MEKVKVYLEKIEWERIYLKLVLDVSSFGTVNRSNVNVYLVDEAFNVETEFSVTDYKDNKLNVYTNITNNGTNRCINNGTYTILISFNEEKYGIVEYCSDVKYLEDKNRCLRYLNARGAYTITFSMDEYSEIPVLNVIIINTFKRALGFVENRCEEKEDSNFILAVAKKIIKKFLPNKRKNIKRIYNFLKSKGHGNRILFLSEQDDKLAHNLRCLKERMAERELNKKYDIRYSLRKKTSEDVSIYSSIRLFYLLLTSDIIIVDDHVPILDWLLLKDTKLVQIWHAGAGFKGVGYSRWGHFGGPGPFSCHRQYSYCISGSKEISHFFSEQFGILEEQVIPTGMPRMDEYLDKNRKESVIENLYSNYPQLKGKRVILFAPTYRGQARNTAYYPYEIINFSKLYDYCNESNSVVLFKMHPWVASSVPIEDKFADRFFDFNSYPDINELFYITDLLITDYSSSMYEYALMNKPMLAFAYDKDQYSMTRGFHRSYNDNVPGKVCQSFDELLIALKCEDYQFEKHADYIKNHFDYVDTSNCDRVIDWLILDNMPDDYSSKLLSRMQHIHEYRSKNLKKYYVKE